MSRVVWVIDGGRSPRRWSVSVSFSVLTGDTRRCFGGVHGIALWNPAGGYSGIDHYYDKLRHLPDEMNTDAARALAEERHQFTKEFIERFEAEWDGER